MPTFRHLLHTLHEPEQFSAAISGAQLKAEFLAPQTKPTLIEQFQSPGWALDFHEAHVKARIHAPLPDGWISLGLLQGTATSQWYGSEATGGMLLRNALGEPIDGCITPGFRSVAIHLPVALWQRCRDLAGAWDQDSSRFAANRLPPRAYANLKRRLHVLRRMLVDVHEAPWLATFAAREAENVATDVAITAWEISSKTAPSLDAVRNRARLARRAEAWMRDRLADAVQVPDVCLALRVSRRELEYAFRSAFDQSPRDFLQALRLNAIRLQLRGTDRTVLSVALDHGITHPGRFAANYRALFAESPSETRSRRRNY